MYGRVNASSPSQGQIFSANQRQQTSQVLTDLRRSVQVNPNLQTGVFPNCPASFKPTIEYSEIQVLCSFVAYSVEGGQISAINCLTNSEASLLRRQHEE